MYLVFTRMPGEMYRAWATQVSVVCTCVTYFERNYVFHCLVWMVQF